jgi:hypothetical protein
MVAIANASQNRILDRTEPPPNEPIRNNYRHCRRKHEPMHARSLKYRVEVTDIRIRHRSRHRLPGENA